MVSSSLSFTFIYFYKDAILRKYTILNDCLIFVQTVIICEFLDSPSVYEPN